MLNQDQLDRAAASLRAGDYNLLLGAAASLGSTNASGEALPLADELRLALCHLKSAKNSHSLQRIYQTLDAAEVDEYITDRFTGCHPGPALRSLPRFIWKRIFTLNIDDALEAAYSIGDPYQLPVVRNYRDPYEEVRERSSVPIIHLHGSVQRPEEGYVFSRDAYVSIIKSANPWMVVLSQLLASEPFFIVGSSLDEVDLDYFLSLRSQATARHDRGPSVLVEPFGDAITDLECERRDLIKFPGTAEEFIAYLDEHVRHRPRANELVSADARSIFIEEPSVHDLSTFYADFEKVPTAVEVNTHDPRFFFGHVPTWSDLTLQFDIARPINNRLIADIDKVFSGQSVRKLVYLSDQVGVGKTTALRRVGFELARQGVTVLLCSAASRLEPRFTASLLDNVVGRCVILVDDFADQVYSIEAIMKLCEKEDIVFVGTERTYRERFVREVLAGTSFTTERSLPLTAREAEQLIDSYLEAGLVGSEEYIKNRSESIEALVGEPIAVACCRILNDLRPLDRIVDSLISVTSRIDRLRYIAAALAQYCTKSGVRFDILIASISGAKINSQFGVNHPMPLALSEEPGRNYVVPLNGTLATRLLEILAVTEKNDLFEVFVNLGKAIAGRVNRRTIVQRTPEARLAARLFDLDQVVQRFLGERAGEFYEAVEDDWRWNSRYWEQLALLNLYKYQGALGDIGDSSYFLDLAVGHARHAVSIERHPLTLTTLAKILFSEAASGSEGRELLVSEAMASISDAIAIERRRSRSSVHPYVVLFQGIKSLGHGYTLGDTEVTAVRVRLAEARRRFSNDAEVISLANEVAVLLN